MTKIKNIIFDLGGVIINLDIQQTIKAFNQLSAFPFESIYTQLQQSKLFDLFDRGEITEKIFFEELQKVLGSSISNDKLVNAWNAMLLDFPLNRLNLLKKLQPNYRLFLLSNTNETHITAFEKSLFEQHGYKNLEPFFEKVYYSCRIGLRKPDSEIFEFVLRNNGLNAQETLFIDDTLQHIEGAKNLEINAKLISKNEEVGVLLKKMNLV